MNNVLHGTSYVNYKFSSYRNSSYYNSQNCLFPFSLLFSNDKMSDKVSIHSTVFLMNLIDLHLTFDNYFLKRADVQMTSL